MAGTTPTPDQVSSVLALLSTPASVPAGVSLTPSSSCFAPPSSLFTDATDSLLKYRSAGGAILPVVPCAVALMQATLTGASSYTLSASQVNSAFVVTCAAGCTLTLPAVPDGSWVLLLPSSDLTVQGAAVLANVPCLLVSVSSTWAPVSGATLQDVVSPTAAQSGSMIQLSTPNVVTFPADSSVGAAFAVQAPAPGFLVTTPSLALSAGTYFFVNTAQGWTQAGGGGCPWSQLVFGSSWSPSLADIEGGRVIVSGPAGCSVALPSCTQGGARLSLKNASANPLSLVVDAGSFSVPASVQGVSSAVELIYTGTGWVVW